MKKNATCSVINTIYGPGIATLGEFEVVIVGSEENESVIKRRYEKQNKQLNIKWVKMDEFFGVKVAI